MNSKQQATQSLRSLLNGGAYPPGSRLPPERDLMLRLGLSRRALRLGLAQLEAEGRLWRHVGKGTFVGTRPPERELGMSLITASTSPAELMDLCLWTEPTYARVAAMRASRMDIDNLRYLLDKSASARDAATWDIWDVRLHRAIAEATHNALALAVFDSLNAVREEGAWRRLRNDPTTAERFEDLTLHHRQIVDAIARHDPPAAEAAMRRHLRSVQHALLLEDADAGTVDGDDAPIDLLPNPFQEDVP
ncbi:GntR family transcriptional regulator [Labrys okinawensis]|uniref:GntR family transcriptional regulator n=1 Tax=Labrys okinawensis TaxID=346911 RepID=A0A2S9Q6H0_9HYPH|nr:FCD domain-containing protein [Labrys okinawensis]PRH84941.1 GntR family transcriptional regulator [Labrys okinawensis]